MFSIAISVISVHSDETLEKKCSITEIIVESTKSRAESFCVKSYEMKKIDVT